jgi:hypothetical protein
MQQDSEIRYLRALIAWHRDTITQEPGDKRTREIVDQTLWMEALDDTDREATEG